jgi:hypothetical protein
VSPSAGSPPSSPSTSSSIFNAPLPTACPLPLPLRGEQNRPTFSPLSCAQQHPRGLAGAAAPPPSGAGRRGCPSPSPEPLDACASSSAACSTRSCTKRWPEAHSRARAGEAPPRAAAPPLFPASSPPPAARTRPGPCDPRWTVRGAYPFDFKWLVHGGPMDRAHGRVHGARARQPPLDLRSTVRSWRF